MDAASQVRHVSTLAVGVASWLQGAGGRGQQTSRQPEVEVVHGKSSLTSQ